MTSTTSLKKIDLRWLWFQCKMLFLPMLQLGPEYPGEHLHLLFTQIPPFRQSGWQVAGIGKKKERIINWTQWVLSWKKTQNHEQNKEKRLQQKQKPKLRGGETNF